jgi:CheY-like chemotaxis protein
VRTLLYVEDNPANLSLVERLIARRPELHLLTATTGRRGIELAHLHQPEVILMDINLPDINGIDALHAIHGHADTAHIPVIAISANAMPHDLARGLQAGFFGYLTKPIKVGEFSETLNKALSFAEGDLSRKKRGVNRP